MTRATSSRRTIRGATGRASGRPLVAAAAAVALLASTAEASAELHFPDGLFLPVGVNLGGAIHPKVKSGFLFGAELSLVYLDKNTFWYGGYVDGLGDLGTEAFRFSVGPELGYANLGADLGYLGQVRRGRYTHGTTVRLLFTLSVVSVYGRWGHLFADPAEADFGEVGVLLKFPFALWSEGRGWNPTPR